MALDEKTKIDPIVETGIEAAKLYGTLVSNGVPAPQATQIVGSYIQSKMITSLTEKLQPPREPWDNS